MEYILKKETKLQCKSSWWNSANKTTRNLCV